MARTFTKNLSNYLTLGVNGINNQITGTSALTCAVWVYPSSLTTSAFDNRIFAEYVTGTNSGILLNIGNSPSVLSVSARSTNTDSFQTKTGTTTITTGTWWHLAGVIDYGAGTVTPYVNGTAEGGGAATFGSTTYSPASVTGYSSIGSLLNTSGVPSSTNPQFAGSIAEVALWKAALSAGEIAALAKGAPATRFRTASFVGYWPMLSDASTVPNMVASVPNGTVTGSLPSAAHPPVGAPFGGNTPLFYPQVSSGVVGPLIGGRFTGGLLIRGRLVRA